MKVILTLILLVGALFVGWVAGSLHPAPASILGPVQAFLTGDELVTETETDIEETPEETVDLAPETDPAPVTPAPSAPATSGDTDEQYRLWISEARAAHPYPESEDKMYAVMMCESGGRADIVNPAGPYVGLFQYVDGTWNGDWNQYRDQGITNARAQIFATALAWNLNMQSHWGCYTRAH